ncbi:hypothetical protein ACFVAJ_16990 [Agromyces sp. NPDC057679]|uniref:hypothetical protein n=1 Tax=Agromyces sp. NPDC057679 TaxID=3346207 RepID=UPI00366C6F4E
MTEIAAPLPLVKRRPALLPALIGVAILLVAIAPLPYPAYLYLRLAVCTVAWILAVTVVRALPDEPARSSWFQEPGVWKSAPLLVVAAVFFFGPASGVEFGKTAWQLIDAVAIAVFLFYGFTVAQASPVRKWVNGERVESPRGPLWVPVAWVVGLHLLLIVYAAMTAGGQDCVEREYGGAGGSSCVSYE